MLPTAKTTRETGSDGTADATTLSRIRRPFAGAVTASVSTSLSTKNGMAVPRSATFPAMSSARAAKVCAPSARPFVLYAAVKVGGKSVARTVAPSRIRIRASPDAASQLDAESEIVPATTAPGDTPEVICATSGGVASTPKDADSTPTFPALS